VSEPRLTPLIPLDLDTRRHLRLEIGDIFLAEQDMCFLWRRQVNILTLFADTAQITLNDLAILLYRALRHEDRLLTLEQTRTFMTFDRLPAIMEAVFTAWNAATQSATPAPEEVPADGPLGFPGVPSGATPVLS
jgi:hypothetical protein